MNIQGINQMNNEGVDSSDIYNKVVDVCFINAVKSLKRDSYIVIFLHFIQILAMGAMVIVNLTAQESQKSEILAFFIAATCVSFVNLTAKIIHLQCYLSNPEVLVRAALMLNHTIDAQQLRNHQYELYGEIPVSKNIYNVQTNITVQEADQSMKKIVEPMLVNLLEGIVQSLDPCYKCIKCLGGLFALTLFVYGIVILATVQKISTVEFVMIIIFCVSEFLIQLKVFLCLLFIAVLPVICIVLCFYVCCCGEGRKEAKLPESQSATVDILQKADASPCSICFQNIAVGEQVVVLPCSQKHIFHDTCIKGWINIKPNCPICRHDLSQ